MRLFIFMLFASMVVSVFLFNLITQVDILRAPSDSKVNIISLSFVSSVLSLCVGLVIEKIKPQYKIVKPRIYWPLLFVFATQFLKLAEGYNYFTILISILLGYTLGSFVESKKKENEKSP